MPQSIYVTIDPLVMGGAPVFKGTRVLVQTLVDHLLAGDGIEEFLLGYPSVTLSQVEAFLQAAVTHAPQDALAA